MIWPLARGAFHSLAHVSDGIRVGTQYGFSSGEMLDYVYENRARGRGPLGRTIDRIYLDSPGWRGIRERRANLVRTLTALVLARRAQGLPTRILDVAAGPGRYWQPSARSPTSWWFQGCTKSCSTKPRSALPSAPSESCCRAAASSC